MQHKDGYKGGKGQLGTPPETNGWWLVSSGVPILCAFLGIVALCVSATRAVANQELGTWLTDDRKAKIVLRECGKEKLCSEIVWLADPLDEKGQPWRDELNPDPSMRRRSVVGIDILVGLKKIAPRKWTGQIYDPEEGKHYYLKHIHVKSDRVEIRGCLSSGWPCRTKMWTRTTPVRATQPVVAETKPSAIKKPAQRQIAAPRVIPPAAANPAAQPPQHEQRAAAAPIPQLPPQTPGLAPAPAQPAERQVVAAPTQTTQPVQRQAGVAPQPAAPERKPAARPVAPAATHPPMTTSALAPRPMTAAPPMTAGDYVVQVTAGQNQNEALRAFGKLQRRFPQLLGGYLPNIQKVDLGAKGVWYRVRVGPMGQRTAAVSFCNQLKAAGGDCLIRRK